MAYYFEAATDYLPTRPYTPGVLFPQLTGHHTVRCCTKCRSEGCPHYSFGNLSPMHKDGIPSHRRPFCSHDATQSTGMTRFHSDKTLPLLVKQASAGQLSRPCWRVHTSCSSTTLSVPRLGIPRNTQSPTGRGITHKQEGCMRKGILTRGQVAPNPLSRRSSHRLRPSCFSTAHLGVTIHWGEAMFWIRTYRIREAWALRKGTTTRTSHLPGCLMSH